MKTLIVSLTVLTCFGNQSFAQGTKGQLLTTVTARYGRVTGDQTDTSLYAPNSSGGSSASRVTNLSFNLSAGYYVADRLAIGLSGQYDLNYSKGTSSNNNGSTNYLNRVSDRSDTYNAGPFVRMDFPIAGKLWVNATVFTSYITTKRFLILDYSIGEQIDRVDMAAVESKGGGVLLTPGLTYLASKPFAVNLGFNLLRYAYAKGTRVDILTEIGSPYIETRQEFKNHDLLFTFRPSLSFGLSYFFGKTAE